MLLFRAEEEVIRWQNESGEPYGESIPLETMWQLSKVWYGNRMSPEFRGRTASEAEAIFAQFGLTSDFWKFA